MGIHLDIQFVQASHGNRQTHTACMHVHYEQMEKLAFDFNCQRKHGDIMNAYMHAHLFKAST